MRRYAFAIAVSLLVLLGVSYAQQPSRPLTTEGLRTAQVPHRYEPPPLMASAAELEATGDQYRVEKAYADAVDYYRAALPKLAQEKNAQCVLYNKVGIAELQMQHFREAEKNFQKSAKLDKEYAEAYNNLGASFYLQKKYGKAVDNYRKALKLREADASFHNNLGSAYFAKKELPLAVTEYRRAFELDPDIFERTSQTGISALLSTPQDRAKYSYLLAKMYAQVGRFDRSIMYLRKAIEEGYKDINNVYKDQEFAGLRKDPRFEELMAAKLPSIPE